MIRRKLTRIEVTLDDTKEIDDLFAKTSQANVCTQTAGLQSQTQSISKISNYQKHLLFLNKPQDFAKSTESPIETIAVSTAISAITNTIVNNTNNPAETAQTSQISPVNTETQSANSSNDPQTAYNPQPYNPTNRFQLNQ